MYDHQRPPHSLLVAALVLAGIFVFGLIGFVIYRMRKTASEPRVKFGMIPKVRVSFKAQKQKQNQKHTNPKKNKMIIII